MTPAQINKAKKTWPSLRKVVRVAHTEKEYKDLVSFLDELLDEVGEDEKHPLASLMEVIGALIENYEEEHWPGRSKVLALVRRALRSTRGTSLPEGKTIRDLIYEGRKR